MDDDLFFPTIKDELLLPLKVALQHASKNPAYLESDQCPYSEGTKNFIRSLASMSGSGVSETASGTTFLDPNADKFAVMFRELDVLYTDLKSFRATLNNMEPNEKATFFKTTMALLEKIASMKERTYNMKEIADFQQAVINAASDILDEDQQKRFIEALDKGNQ